MNKTQQKNDGRKKIIENSLQKKHDVPQDTLQVKVGGST